MEEIDVHVDFELPSWSKTLVVLGLQLLWVDTPSVVKSIYFKWDLLFLSHDQAWTIQIIYSIFPLNYHLTLEHWILYLSYNVDSKWSSVIHAES